MFSMKDITQLIWYAHGIAYPHIHIIVRMTIYPEVDTAILDIIFQFYGEGSVCLTIGKLGTLHLERRYMMSDNDLFWLCCMKRLLSECKTPIVLTVEVFQNELIASTCIDRFVYKAIKKILFGGYWWFEKEVLTLLQIQKNANVLNGYYQNTQWWRHDSIVNVSKMQSLDIQNREYRSQRMPLWTER